jgi:hypothetical protein
MTYETLKVGDTRQKGDEVRNKDRGEGEIKCHGIWESWFAGKRLGGKVDCSHFREPTPPNPGEWEPVQLLGHAILASDLMLTEFRRWYDS